MIKRYVAVFVLLAGSTLAAYSADFKYTPYSGLKEAGASYTAPQVEQAKAGVNGIPSVVSARTQAAKEWTVMVFMNGKNNVEKCAVLDMNEMEAVGSTDKVNVVVELGRIKGGMLDFGWKGVRRYYVTKDDKPSKITSQLLQEDEKADMGDYHRVVDFVNWAKRNYPAKHYMLVMWNHGLGFLDPKKAETDRGISFDDESKNYITTKELGIMMKSIGNVDILAFNACLMQNAEVMYEIKDYAGVIVGSEEVMSGAGYDYTTFLEGMNANTKSTDAIVKQLVDGYIKFYMQYSYIIKGAHVAAVRPSKMPQLASLASQWADLALKVKDTAAINAARDNVIRFDIDPVNDKNKEIAMFGDLYHFVELVNANLTVNTPDAQALKAKGAEIMSLISTQLVSEYRSYGVERTGKSFSLAHGISIHLPMKKRGASFSMLEPNFETKYADLAFSQATNWDEFVNWGYTLP